MLCTALGTAQVHAAHVASSSAPRWHAPIFLRSSKHTATLRFHETLVEKCAAHTSARRALPLKVRGCACGVRAPRTFRTRDRHALLPGANGRAALLFACSAQVHELRRPAHPGAARQKQRS